MEVTYYQFCKTIAEDFGIELNQKHKTKFNQFPIKKGILIQSFNHKEKQQNGKLQIRCKSR
jgi:hypothetical protein